MTSGGHPNRPMIETTKRGSQRKWGRMPITCNASHQEMESKLLQLAKDGGLAAETIFTWEGDGLEDVHKNFTNIAQ